MKKTFRGGIRINEHKNTDGKPIDYGFSPKSVIIPMQQHIGAPCDCVVQKGDSVMKYQLIGIAADGLSCPVHSGVSGTVTDVCEMIGINGQKTVCAVIENDGKDTEDHSLEPINYAEASSDTIIKRIREAGISGMGGATFPTYAKLTSALGKVDTAIINCSECEPYITANHRLLLEYTDSFLEGIKILIHTLSLPKAVIGISDNKPDAIKLLKNKTKGDEHFEIAVLKTKYPQGDERQLIYAITGRQIPTGKLPADVGCVVFNAETVYAVYNAVVCGRPVSEKIVTVDGDCIEDPKCVKVPIGTKYSELIEYCKKSDGEIDRIISGGPMMGFTVWDENTSVTKGCSSVLVFKEEANQSKTANASCIRCGRCVRACPMHLTPSYIFQFAKKDMLDTCEKLGARSCVECGSCSYVCPAKIPVSQYIRTAKVKIAAKSRRAK